MTSGETRYDFKTVHTVRGAEARAKTKWQQAGWEFVEQTPDSILRMKLLFRKPAPKRPPLVVMVGLGVLLIIGVSLAAFFEKDDPADQTLAAPSITATKEASAASPSRQPSQQASESPTAEFRPAEAEGSAESTSEAPTVEPETSATEPAQILTVENSADLAALLQELEPGSSVVETFAANNDDALLEFDANIAYLAPHGEYETRFDLLIKPGNYSETSQSGPNFKFENVNIVSDLKLNGQGAPDSISAGQNVRIIARVGSYNPTQELFFLEPVSTQIR
ncbi:DUF4839 domain-containing protein [Arthrobacter sp. B1805]|uniref:DUF4839 domain-containing protein n=1 Tax=Arthrobacter sp. B1805 TaxID=2058892 RepID=UPI000CE30E40|nr:DUF4839 domain-containing protein [Arthrobacter sp. B1805]